MDKEVNRKAAERAIDRESGEDKYRLLIENVHDGIYQSTVDGTILMANPALVKMLGYETEDELKSMNIGKDIYVNGSDRDRYLNFLEEKGSLDDAELVLKRKDGSFIIVLEHARIVKNDSGEILFYEGTLSDITRRKAAEKALLESEQKYHTLIEASQDGISLFDLTGRMHYFNQRKKKMLGYLLDDEFIEINTFDMIHPDDRSTSLGLFNDLMKKGSIGGMELRIIRKDGSFFWAEFNAEIVKGEDGNPTYIMDTMRDITERKRNVEEVQLHLQQIRQIIDLVPSYIFAKDIDGMFLLVNKALAEVFGLSPDEIKGKTDADYGASPEQISGYRSADMAVIEKGLSVNIPEEQVLRKDGTLGWFQTVKIPYKHPGWDKPAILGIATEISERKQIEDELRKSEERFRKLFESHSAIKLLINSDTGSIVDANMAAVEFYGWPASKLRKMNMQELCCTRPEEFMNRMENTKREKGIFFESTHILADGSKREVEVFSSRVELEGKYLVHAIIHDITDKKRIFKDLMDAKEHAEESDRLKTAFLHNISHEIRTPMNAIVGFTSLLESPELSVEARKQYINIIHQSSNQLLSIITDIVDISNIETGRTKVTPEKVNLNSLFRNIYEQFYFRAKIENISFTIKTPIEDESAFILSDEIKLIQVLSNLLNNSFKFTSEGYIDCGYKVENDLISFWVRDTGIGIPDSERERIFERFYQVENSTTHKTGGTGLGLSISKAYVELMGGKIWVVSQPGDGSSFYFTIPYIPVKGINNEEKQTLTSKEVTFSDGKSILIAEDDDINFLLLSEILSGHNINIIRALNGLEAVNACDNTSKIDLVLMDIKMPVMDGYQATELIKKKRPELAVIAVTAYTQEKNSDNIADFGFSDYISKPIDRDQLIKILKKHLGTSK
jgi:PAS domain S-box-containing protein